MDRKIAPMGFFVRPRPSDLFTPSPLHRSGPGCSTDDTDEGEQGAAPELRPNVFAEFELRA